MKKFIKISSKNSNKIIFVIVLLIILTAFLFLYSRLYLFGDAANHAYLSLEIYERGIWDYSGNYPPFYHVLQAQLFAFYGENGLQLIVLFGVLLMFCSVYLLGNELFHKKKLSIFLAFMAIISPKIIFLSARQYMEILLTGFSLYSIYYLVKFMRTRSISTLILLGIFMGITSVIKQQGLFIVIPSIGLTTIVFIVKEYGFGGLYRRLLSLAVSFILIIVPFYGILFHNYGKILPGSESYSIVRGINTVGQKIFRFKDALKEDNQNEFEEDFSKIRKKYYKQGTIEAESRHIWPTEPFTSFSKFFETFSLYLQNFRGSSIPSIIIGGFNSLLLIGIVLAIRCFFKDDRLIVIKEMKYLLLFYFIFTINNLVFFSRNNHQIRYHLFLAVAFIVFVGLPIKCFLTKFSSFMLDISRIVFVTILSLIMIISFVKDIDANLSWNSTQAYAPSYGGIPSIRETGYWIKENSSPDYKIWQGCGGSTIKFYSRRETAGGWKVYFLPPDKLEVFLDSENIKYVVLYDSLVVPDAEWTNICKNPESFRRRIEEMYPRVFTSSYNDIHVFEVK